MSKEKGKEKEKKSQILTVRVARKEVPDVGELVVGTVTKIFDHGAYVALDEYGGLEAYAPINEIVQSWFHSIKDYLKINQKAVFRVIRVDFKRKLVDISLRRVRDEEKKEKLMRWKRTLRAVKLLEIISQKLNIPLQELIINVGWKLEDYYGDMLRGFEEIVKEGIKVLLRLGISENIAKAIEEVAKQHIEVSEVTLSGIVRLINLKPNGIEHIREVLSRALQIASKLGNNNTRIYTIGPPRYRIDITGKDPKHLENVLKEVVNFIIEEAKKRGGEASFSRIT